MTHSATTSVRCIGCGHDYAPQAWSELPKVRTLTSHDVHAYVVAWPPDRLVEVRACCSCGRRIARTVRADSANAVAGIVG
jgi:hypothetical protein